LAKVIMSDHIRRQYPDLHRRFTMAHRKYENEIRKALDDAAKSAQIPSKLDRRAATTLFDAAQVFVLLEQALGCAA